MHANRHPESAQQVVENITADGGAARMTTFDVADPDATRKAIELLLDEGPIQVLVHNAGVHDDAPMAGMTIEQWKKCSMFR